MAAASITFNLIVGQSYAIHYREQSAQLAFIGMVTNGNRQVLLFHNPLGLGVPYEYIGAALETVWPETISQTVTMEIRLAARLVGQDREHLTLLTNLQAQVWGSGLQG